jgi:hypothetical protein
MFDASGSVIGSVKMVRGPKGNAVSIYKSRAPGGFKNMGHLLAAREAG